jgi:hypothetical protein
MFKLASKFHPIFGIGVHVCDKIVDSTTSTQPLQRRVRFSENIMEHIIPNVETREEKLARLMERCDEICPPR